MLLRLARSRIAAIDDLYEARARHALGGPSGADGTLAVEVTSTIRQGPLANLNTHFAEQRVKDAVVDRFRDERARRPGWIWSAPTSASPSTSAAGGGHVSLDLSGDGLHRRGYRLEGGEAPLKENLAAAILLRAGWPGIAAAGRGAARPHVRLGHPAHRGRLMAADIAPGLLREYYGFLGWKGFEPGDLGASCSPKPASGARRAWTAPAALRLRHGSRGARTARANARRAGLAGRISLERAGSRSARGSPAGAAPGLVVTNPPYGKRLGEVSELAGLYETLGERLKESFTGWEAAVFTGNPELSAHLGLRAHRLNVFYNGPLACKLLRVHAIGDRSCAARADGAADRRSREDYRRAARTEHRRRALMFANRLQKNLKHLSRWADPREHPLLPRLRRRPA